MVAASLLRDINATLGHLYDQRFEEDLSFDSSHPFKIKCKIETEDSSTAFCIQEILKRAFELAYLEGRTSSCFIEGSNLHEFSITRESYNNIKGRISSVFLDKLRDFSHIYLHYLHQGWKEIPRSEEVFKDSEDTVESLYMEKKENFALQRGQGPLLSCLAKIAGCEVFYIRAHAAHGWATYVTDLRTKLHGTREGVSRLFRFIQAQAEDVIVKVPLPVVRASQIEGGRPLQTFLRKKNREFIETSRSFLRD